MPGRHRQHHRALLRDRSPVTIRMSRPISRRFDLSTPGRAHPEPARVLARRRGCRRRGRRSSRGASRARGRAATGSRRSGTARAAASSLSSCSPARGQRRGDLVAVPQLGLEVRVPDVLDHEVRLGERREALDDPVVERLRSRVRDEHRVVALLERQEARLTPGTTHTDRFESARTQHRVAACARSRPAAPARARTTPRTSTCSCAGRAARRRRRRSCSTSVASSGRRRASS